jgi:hypothetical protein
MCADVEEVHATSISRIGKHLPNYTASRLSFIVTAERNHNLTIVLWHIDPLQGRDLERNNGATAIVMQRRGKYASTIIVTWKRCVLCGLCQGVILKTVGATQLVVSRGTR